MIEAVCFPKEHHYLKSESAHGGYVCKYCRDWISDAEFEKRANKGLQVDGRYPLAWCEGCQAYHVPVEYWGSNPAPAPKA